MGNALDKKGGIDPRYYLPQGQFSKTAWDPKLLKKSVMERKLAPFFPGVEEKAADLEECPICFLYYPGGLNRAKCCRKGVCSECYVQIKKGQNSVTSCPFCNNRRYMVVYTGPLSKEEREAEESEEKKVQELRAKMLLEESSRRDSAPVSPSPALTSSSSSMASSPASPLSASSPYSSEQRKDSSAGGSALPAAPAPPAHVAPAPEFDIFVPPPGVNAEEAMIAEAIRRSLLESNAAPAPERSSVSSEPPSAASLSEAPPAAVLSDPTPRRIALEEPSESKSTKSDSEASSVTENDERAAGRRAKRDSGAESSLADSSVASGSNSNDDAELREAIRLSLLEADGSDAPAAVRP